MHDNQRDYKCDSCGKSFNFAHTLKQHVKIVHEGLERQRFKCDLCSKSFHTEQYLRDHKAVSHEGRRDYKCEFCGKSYTSARVVANHIKTIHYVEVEAIRYSLTVEDQ